MSRPRSRFLTGSEEFSPSISCSFIGPDIGQKLCCVGTAESECLSKNLGGCTALTYKENLPRSQLHGPILVEV